MDEHNNSCAWIHVQEPLWFDEESSSISWCAWDRIHLKWGGYTCKKFTASVIGWGVLIYLLICFYIFGRVNPLEVGRAHMQEFIEPLWFDKESCFNLLMWFYIFGGVNSLEVGRVQMQELIEALWCDEESCFISWCDSTFFEWARHTCKNLYLVLVGEVFYWTQFRMVIVTHCIQLGSWIDQHETAHLCLIACTRPFCIFSLMMASWGCGWCFEASLGLVELGQCCCWNVPVVVVLCGSASFCFLRSLDCSGGGYLFLFSLKSRVWYISG